MALAQLPVRRVPGPAAAAAPLPAVPRRVRVAGAGGEAACLPGTPGLAAAGKGRRWGGGEPPGKRKAIFCSR